MSRPLQPDTQTPLETGSSELDQPPNGIFSFAAVARADAKILILGSMPGVASLQAGQYYAHPRNAFWPIIGRLLNRSPEWATSRYDDRIEDLLAAGIALWDVLASCQRSGSLDTNIVRDSEVANPIEEWLQQLPQLRVIALNGSKANSAFKRHINPKLAGVHCGALADRPSPEILLLPSTSPAHAARTLEQKYVQWSQLAGWLAP